MKLRNFIQKLRIDPITGVIGIIGVCLMYPVWIVYPYVACSPVEVPLPNGYSYSPDSQGHLISTRRLNQSGGKIIGDFSFVNRIDVYRQYVVGEVIPWKKEGNTEQFSYFIIDTQTGTSSGAISKVSYEQQLATLQLTHKIRLRKRSHQWRGAMCFKHG